MNKNNKIKKKKLEALQYQIKKYFDEIRRNI